MRCINVGNYAQTLVECLPYTEKRISLQSGPFSQVLQPVNMDLCYFIICNICSDHITTLQGDTSGDYRRILMALAGEDH